VKYILGSQCISIVKDVSNRISRMGFTSDAHCTSVHCVREMVVVVGYQR
jgi:hypothetical protein